MRIKDILDVNSMLVFSELRPLWLLGSSLIKRACDHTQRRPTGYNLRLENYGCRVVWIHMNGMKWHDVLNTVKGMLLVHGYPSAIIIHCGGNDIGDVPLGLLLYNIKQTLSALIYEILPGIPLIWSSILPRLSWRHSPKSNKMEHTRKRINRAIRSFLLKRNCYIIKYPDFDDKLRSLFDNDGVHLSFIGNDLFINAIQGAMETFIDNPWYHVYPLAV